MLDSMNKPRVLCLFSVLDSMCNSTVLCLFSVLDSMGKPGSGILQGNLRWWGVFDQCKAVEGQEFSGQYCLPKIGVSSNIRKKTVRLFTHLFVVVNVYTLNKNV